MDKQELLNKLRAGPTYVKFIKNDGEIREMNYTLNESFLPPRQEDNLTQTKRENPNVQSVWDIDKQAWRSFRWDRLVNPDTAQDES